MGSISKTPTAPTERAVLNNQSGTMDLSQINNSYIIAKSPVGATKHTPIMQRISVSFFIKSISKIKCKVSTAFCYPKEKNKKHHDY